MSVAASPQTFTSTNGAHQEASPNRGVEEITEISMLTAQPDATKHQESNVALKQVHGEGTVSF